MIWPLAQWQDHGPAGSSGDKDQRTTQPGHFSSLQDHPANDILISGGMSQGQLEPEGSSRRSCSWSQIYGCHLLQELEQTGQGHQTLAQPASGRSRSVFYAKEKPRHRGQGSGCGLDHILLMQPSQRAISRKTLIGTAT